MSKEERYVEHTAAWELPNGDSVTKSNYNLADIETKYMPIQTEVICDNKDKTIADLKAKLVESESKRKSLEEKVKFLTEETEENFVDGQKYNELKQQLAEKEKEISEYIKIVDDLHKQLSDKCDFCDKTKDQDKISFALEQLEKVKGLIANHTQELWTCENDDIDVVLYEEIDKQIKRLKEMK